MNMKQALVGLVVILSFGSVAHSEIPIRDLSDYTKWVVGRISTWSPPGRTYVPEAKETQEEATERYNEIAQDAMEVAFDPNERPLFNGPYARSQTMALILSVAWWESGYRKDVDLNLGKLARGDSGRSWCLMQIQLGKPIDDKDTTATRVHLKDNTVEFSTEIGFTGGDLIKDRQACFRAGLHIIRSSFYACHNLPILDRLSAYTSGSCKQDQHESQDRVRKAMEWLARSIPPLTDEQVITHLEEEESNADVSFNNVGQNQSQLGD